MTPEFRLFASAVAYLIVFTGVWLFHDSIHNRVKAFRYKVQKAFHQKPMISHPHDGDI